MATNANINIERAVSRFMFKYKLPTEDAFLYTEHACDCYRDFCAYDSSMSITLKTYVNVNKWIDMPTDLVSFIDLCIPQGGSWWSFTERDDIVHTTTYTGIIEGRDSAFGEGVDLQVPRTYGYAARGGINDYNYKIDWQFRRIYVSGIDVNETVVLIYVSSGIQISGTTSVPEIFLPVLDAYLLWKSSYWRPELVRERAMLEKDYEKARLNIRNLMNSMSYNQWRDVILSSVYQAPKR